MDTTTNSYVAYLVDEDGVILAETDAYDDADAAYYEAEWRIADADEDLAEYVYAISTREFHEDEDTSDSTGGRQVRYRRWGV